MTNVKLAREVIGFRSANRRDGRTGKA